jgi:hypothetical protein
MLPKIGVLDEPKGGGKEEKNDREWIMETSHLFRNKTQGSTQKTIEQHRMGEKGKENSGRG